MDIRTLDRCTTRKWPGSCPAISSTEARRLFWIRPQKGETQLQHPVAFPHRLRVYVNLAPQLPEPLRHLRHALLLVVERGGIIAHVLGDLHRAEFRPAHRAEMRDLVRLIGKGLD